ncbi:MAG: tetratricopeptide repeat protein [Vicinamibacteria bacterium]|nr:tetratricopeptide repeat protein [Vicinamibacteria bacterium]
MRRVFMMVMATIVLAGVCGMPVWAAKKEKAVDKKPVIVLTPGQEAVAKAEAKAAEGQIAQAIDMLRMATSKEGMTGEPFLKLGQLLETTTEVDRTIEAYQEAGARLTGAAKAEALGRLALMQEMNGALEDATASAEAAAAADAENAWATLVLARARVRQSKLDEALALAQKAVAAGSAKAAAGAALGLVQESRGDIPAAEAAYREATAADANSVLGNFGLARVLRKSGKAAEADPLITRVNEKTPWFIEGCKEAVLVKMALGQFVAALEQAQTAATLNDQDLVAQRLVDDVKIGQARDYVKKNQFDLAIEDINNLLVQKPKIAEAYIVLGQAQMGKRQLDAAIASFNKAIELDPKAAEARYQLGVLQQDLKSNVAGAIVEFEKAVALDDKNVEYRIRFGNALTTVKGQGDKAIAELTKVTEATGETRADGWMYLAGAYLNSERYSDAVTAGLKSLALLDQQPESPMNTSVRGMTCKYMAWAYLNLKDKDNVIKYGLLAQQLGQKDTLLFNKVAALQSGAPLAGVAATKPAARKTGARSAPRR